MNIKDTIHFNWYKHLFIVLLICVCIWGCISATGADFAEVFGNFDQMYAFLSRFLKPDFSYLPKLIQPMLSTLQMSVVGTAIGVLFAVPIAFIGTTLVTGNKVLTSVIRFFLDIIRTIPNLLLAALMVAIMGIGEFSGVMTIAVFTFGLVSQLVYEAIEAIDEGPIEAAMAVGANKVQIAQYAVAPQILSQVAGYAFYAFEINVRASAVLGYVGAGGIGVILNSSLALLKYNRVSVIILLIFFVVTIVDGISEHIRRRLS